ncbi:SUMF1/EgtB/PvdO family nonheme iron enzyme [Cylindrospermum sp. FACHB-282]|nr:SUMF1/EgtB/PvdO family nonheme iron enzyme [Cylindrospermum sp. FACHB-282]
MTPEFYPFKDGYRIFLAKSPKDDPKLKYRQEFDKIALEDEGDISDVNRFYLNELGNSLKLSAGEADIIEFEVLEPYRQRQEKLQRYEQALSQVIQRQYPLSEKDQNGLKRLQEILNLRDEDVAPIKERVLAPKQLEYKPQPQEPELLQKPPEKVLSQPGSQKQSPSIIQTQPFEFDTATLVKKTGFLGIGKTWEIKRRRERAEFFTEDLGNGVILDMVAIPGGQFLMGSPDNELERRDNESPQHHVTIQPFFLGKYLVTQSQWKVVAALPKVKIDLNSDPSRFIGASRPVEQVSWNHVIEFCARLSHKTGKIYRLPSEAEWEYACRAGTTTPFYFGETISTDLANYNGNLIYGSGSTGEYLQQTTDVGKFPPNAFGLYDMHGNICEWCQDGWHKNYIIAPTDGSVWINDNDNRMLRGGSWFYDPDYCRSACRFSNDAGDRGNNFGFRVACPAA